MVASEVQGPIITDVQSGAISVKKPSIPVKVTTSDSAAYIHACALSNQKASKNNPLSILFQCEKLPAFPDEETYQDATGKSYPTPNAVRRRSVTLSGEQLEELIYEASVRRTKMYLQSGGFVAEAGNFAATTVWEPAFAPSQAGTASHNTISLTPREDCPLFNSFLSQINNFKRKYLYPIIWRAKQNNNTSRIVDEWTSKVLSKVADEHRSLMYWHLTLTSRNPAVQPPVPGAVRAVIEPFVKRWVHEAGMPAVWLEAGSPHARDIYSYFGFKVVGEVVIGQDEAGKDGISTWCMIYTRDNEQI